MSDLVKLRADAGHPEILATGATIAPGEPFERSLLTDADQRLTDEGLLIDAQITPTEEPMSVVRQRAQQFDIDGRSKMSPDELREAVALAEAQQGQASAAPADDTQRMGG